MSYKVKLLTLDLVARSVVAIDPISVFRLVAKTIPRALPLVTIDELYTTFRRSPRPVSSSRRRVGSLRTGSDSLVRNALSVSKLIASINL